MTAENVEKALAKYSKEIQKERVSMLEEYLRNTPDECMDELMNLPIKSIKKTLLFSIFLGGIGVDRFYLGNTDLATGKLGVGLVIDMLAAFWTATPDPALMKLIVTLSIIATAWCISDIFIAHNAAKKTNYNTIMTFLSNHRATAKN